MKGGADKRRGPAGDPFLGGGDAGARLRAIDWSKKSVGAVEGWPQSLRTALSIALVSRHPICILWGPERLYFYNDAYAPIVGAKHPWALGESYITVWPEIWESVIRPILEQVETTGEASWADNLLLVLRRHGYDEECYFAFSFAPIRIEDGSVGGVFTAITETTPQVVGERRLRTLRDLGARGPEAKSAEEACRIAGEVLAENRFDVPFALFYLIDADGRMARLVEPTGIARSAILAPETVSLVGGGDEENWGLPQVAAAGKPVTRQLSRDRGERFSGGPWPEPAHSAVVLPIARPGETVPYGFLVSGVSPRRPLDEAYHGFLGLVAAQVATAISNARAISEARRRAEALAELDRAKTDFFSNVSHEFRTPLTLLLGPLEELLGGKAGAELTPGTRAIVEVAHRNSLRLLKLVNSLLDFSRIEAGRMEVCYEAVDLAELTAELASVFRAAIEQAGLKLIVACQAAPEPAYVDRELWEKIVFNLLSNAYKFTRRGEILVEVWTTPEHFEFSVRDTGVGIAPEHQAEVFKRFHRVENAFSRTHEGSGIGLALVQELTQLHGGTVGLESGVGKGSKFTVRIPRGRAHLPAERIGGVRAPRVTVRSNAFVEESLRWRSGEEEGLAAAAEKGETLPLKSGPAPRVLLAEDNGDMREYVRRLLSGSFEVRAVADGAAALAVAREWVPDLVLTDTMMPGMDGFELTKALREDVRTRAIPVVMLSARAGEEARVDGLEAGADDYLIKPFSARELLARLKAHLHLVELRRAAAAQVGASEARFQLLVELLPVGVCACDAEGRVTFFNRKAVEIWGAAPELGGSYEDFASAFKLFTLEGRPIEREQRQLLEKLKNEGAAQQSELLVERPDGSRFIASVSLGPTRDSKGNVTGSINVFQDVTAEKRTRSILHQTEERYRAIFQQASVGIFECDLQGFVMRSNPALTRIVGYTAEELLGRNWRELVPLDELKTDDLIARELVKRERESFSAERRYQRKDGSTGWLDLFATLILNEAGKPAYGLGVVIDVTERRRAAAELRETERRFQVAADSAPVLIWMTDARQRCAWCNQLWLDYVGRTMEEEKAAGWLGSVHPDDAERAARTFTAAFASREPFTMEYRLRRHDGEYRWMLARGVPRDKGGEFAGYIGSCVDIEDRRGAEHAMHESRNAERARRQELEVITQVAPAGIWMAQDPACSRVTGNATAHALMRVPAGENLSRTADDAPHVRQMDIFAAGKPVRTEDLPLRVAIRTGQLVLNRELEFRFPDGTSTWVYGSATPLFDEPGKVRGAVCIMVDITERRQTEAALRHSEEQLRLVTDHASVFLAQLDHQHRYRFVNRSYAERYGMQPHELVGRHVVEVVGEEAYARARDQMDRALAGEQVEFEMEVRIGAERRWAHIVFVPERTADGVITGLVAVLADITQRKRAETEWKRARDEAIAASRAKDDFLAALSHELRTPLSPVLLLASEAAVDPDLPPQQRADFETIRKSIELEARLIDDLLDLTRITRGKLVLDARPIDVGPVLRDAVATVGAEFTAKDIALSLDLAVEPQVVWGDPVRLQQVFWNVLKNAVKFTPAGGRVAIASRLEREHGRMVVEISDTGIGITAPELERVFEAFSQGDHAAGGGSHRFGGLGLGLAISRRVVELHGGAITAVSGGRDLGAVFRIELPLPGGTAGAAPPAPREHSGTSGAEAPIRSLEIAGRILLVEDHAPTRAALQYLLERRHYTVCAAASLTEARALARGGAFDLLISDIGLPDGSGYELMSELRDRHGLKGIALTGYGMEDDVARSQAAGFVRHLTKPVRIQALDAALAAVKDGGGG